MPFTLGQMFGGWGKKGSAKKASHREGELHSHRARASEPPQRGLSASDSNEASPKATPSKSRAIEERYKVNVESLNVLNMPSKKRRRGNTIGLKSGFKKVIVALKQGQTIS